MTEGLRLLREHLKITGKTQRDLAREVKRSEPTVSLWLSGGNKPDLDSALALQELAGVPVEAWSRKRRAS